MKRKVKRIARLTLTQWRQRWPDAYFDGNVVRSRFYGVIAVG